MHKNIHTRARTHTHTHVRSYTHTVLHTYTYTFGSYIGFVFCFRPSPGISVSTRLTRFACALQEEHKKVMSLVAKLIDHVIANGTRNCTMPWASTEPDTTITHVDRRESRFIKPRNQYWEKSFYVAQKGDPATNGLGHSCVMKNGQEFVVIPGAFLRVGLWN